MDCPNEDCSFIHEAQTSPQTDSVQPPTAAHKDSNAQQTPFRKYNPINNPQRDQAELWQSQQKRTSNRNNHNQRQNGNYTMDTTPAPTPAPMNKKWII